MKPAADPRVPRTETQLRALVREVASFFDDDPSHSRVSEARAISDLLLAASTPDARLFTIFVEEKHPGEFARDGDGIYEALQRLDDLTYTYGDREPWFNGFVALKVVNGRLFLGPPLERHFSFNFSGNNDLPRRDLQPFLGQILPPKAVAADRRTNREREPAPVRSVDIKLTERLEARMERARSFYHGYDGNNAAMMREIIGICLVHDTEAICRAGNALALRHWKTDRQNNHDNQTAAVLDLLEQLLWGPSRIAKKFDVQWYYVKQIVGKLVYNSDFTHLPADTDRWADRQNVNACYWRRRNLSRYASQASR